MIDERRRFRPEPRVGEVLAIQPQALEFSYLWAGFPCNERTANNIAVVTIMGPLEHHATAEWDSYESILERLEDAMRGTDMPRLTALLAGDDVMGPAIKPRAVVLKIDSPGGEAAGATFAHRQMLKLRKKYNIPLYAYANEMAASAAYELACACDEIWLPDTGTVGSIGVIATLYDRTKYNKMTGLAIELVTSGTRKADNHADRELTDDIRKRVQGRVEQLANVFWSVVAKSRGCSVEAIAELEASVFIGQDAVDVGIADGISNWFEFLSLISSSIEG